MTITSTFLQETQLDEDNKPGAWVSQNWYALIVAYIDHQYLKCRINHEILCYSIVILYLISHMHSMLLLFYLYCIIDWHTIWSWIIRLRINRDLSFQNNVYFVVTVQAMCIIIFTIIILLIYTWYTFL